MYDVCLSCGTKFDSGVCLDPDQLDCDDCWLAIEELVNPELSFDELELGGEG